MAKTVGMISLGCPKNLVDSEVMLGILEKAGYKIVADPSRASVLIVNTCGFIEDAKRESIDTILEMTEYKKTGKTKHLIVAGCLPQRYKKELTKLLPEVDLFIGTGEYHKIDKIILETEKRKDIEPDKYIGVPEYIHSAKTPRKVATRPHSVYVKIAEGCFHACSFCIIPKIRGGYRSRRPSDIVEETKRLIKGGAREINLIAQDTTAYGRDLKTDTDIVRLLEKIAKVSPKIWIRLLYTYPQSFKRGIIKLMKEYESICRYIDIPIQHIDDDILLKMRRGRSEKKIRSLINYIKKEVPDAALRTSIITGFPGETARQHKRLLEFISRGNFDHVGVFCYSEEEGTSAARMEGHLPEKTKQERRDELMKAEEEISRKQLRRYVGETLDVLVEGICGETDLLFEGRSCFQAPEIDGIVYVGEGRPILGDFNSVEITGSDDYDLIGKVRG